MTSLDFLGRDVAAGRGQAGKPGSGRSVYLLWCQSIKIEDEDENEYDNDNEHDRGLTPQLTLTLALLPPNQKLTRTPPVTALES